MFPTDPSLRPSASHALPFLVATYVLGYAGALWLVESSLGGWLPADPVRVALAAVPAVAYGVAVLAVAVGDERLPAPSPPRLAGLLAFGAATATTFGFVLFGVSGSADVVALAVIVTLCWPAAVGVWASISAAWSGSLPVVVIPIGAGLGAAATALWQYWLAGQLAALWMAAVEKRGVE